MKRLVLRAYYELRFAGHFALRLLGRFFLHDPRRVLRAAVVRSGLSFTIFLGVLSIVLPIVELFANISRSVGVLVVLFFVLFLLSFYFSGLVALMTMSPKEYAKCLVSGRPPRRQMLVLGSEIEFACSSLLGFSGLMQQEMKRVETIKERWEWRRKRAGKSRPLDYWKPFLDEIRGLAESVEFKIFVRYLPFFVRWQQRHLLRVLETKERAADELKIPIRQLCDHFLQYSPIIHEARLRRYQANWEELIEFTSGGMPVSLIGRCAGITKENIDIRKESKSRLESQMMLRANASMLDILVDLATVHSTSLGVQAYGSLVSRAGEEALRRLGNARRAFFIRKSNSQPEYESVSEVEENSVIWADGYMNFAFRKRFCYQGCDLNNLSTRLLQSENPDDLPEEQRDLVVGLRSLLELVGENNFALGKTGGEGGGVVTVTEHRFGQAEKQLQIFKNASRLVAALLLDKRQRLISNFSFFFKDWVGSLGDQASYLVVHGYSKTVKESLLDVELYSDLAYSSEARRLFLFILFEDEEEFGDARLMAHELRESGLGKSFQGISMGSARTFSSFVCPDDRILLLLSAEVWGGDPRVPRILHAKGLGAFLGRITGLPNGDSVEWALLVEKYKYQPSCPTASGIYGEFNERLEQFDLEGYFPESCNGRVISDEALEDEKD